MLGGGGGCSNTQDLFGFQSPGQDSRVLGPRAEAGEVEKEKTMAASGRDHRQTSYKPPRGKTSTPLTDECMGFPGTELTEANAELGHHPCVRPLRGQAHNRLGSALNGCSSTVALEQRATQ